MVVFKEDSIEKFHTNEIKVSNYFLEMDVGKNLEYSRKDNKKIFVNEDGNWYEDIRISDIDFKKRISDFFKRNEIFYISEIYFKDEDYFLNSSRVGKKTVADAIDTIKNVELKLVEMGSNESKHYPNILFSAVYKFLKKYINFEPVEFYDAIADLLVNYLDSIDFDFEIEKCLADEKFLDSLYENIYLKEKFEEFIVKCLNKNIYGFNEEHIYNKIPCILKNRKFLRESLLNLIEASIIVYESGNYIVNHPPFLDGIKNILDERDCFVLNNRLQDFTLEDISVLLDLTRERVRQIQSTSLRKINKSSIRFKEDIYYGIYKNYDITADEFYVAFGCNQAYNYLNLRYGTKTSKKNKAKLPLSESLDDDNIPEFIKRKIEKAVYKDYVKIGRVYIPCRKNDIALYVLRTFAKEDIRLDEFIKIYSDILESIGKSNDEKLVLVGRGYENSLSDSNKVLWKYKKRLRYYNIDDYDFDELFSTLNLNQYKNVEYSTRKFFKLYETLMDDYDIRDEYELHNLLKKICKKEDYPDIVFARMPNIVIGKADRDSQVLDLLLSLAPISNEEFALEYEKEYGVQPNTVLANYMKSFDEYLHEGMYRIDFPVLPNYIGEKLKGILIGDFYLIEDIRAIYLKEFPYADIKLLNPFSIKNLGFKMYSKYVISEKYSSATEYFRDLLTNDDIVDTSLFPLAIKQQVTYTSTLYKLRYDYDIVEFSIDKYINFSKLSQLGITKEKLENYVNDVAEFVSEDEFFTIYSLKKNGFSHELNNLNFSNWFYSSILSENKEALSYVRFGKNKIFIKGKIKFKSSEFIEYIVNKQTNLYINLYHLEDVLINCYDVNINIYKVVEIIKNSEMFYDAVSKTIYANYDVYIEKTTLGDVSF